MVCRALLASLFVKCASAAATAQSKCGNIKKVYKDESCCGKPDDVTNFQMVPMPQTTNLLSEANPCEGAKLTTGYENKACMVDGVVQALEQAGANVTEGYQGNFSTDKVPITEPYWKAGLCPVNVHWHLGAEHASAGQYDPAGTGPSTDLTARRGFQCMHYDSTNTKFTTEYNWQYCKDMKVGETYEVHWPHSAVGACGTPDQYQTPFYDGVFCNSSALTSTNLQIGVQAQVFTIINDDTYYYPDLMRGMIVDSQKQMGINIAKYTGSTTGTSRNNTICSAYTPITWQVDRKCHLISASTFDKMCADMLSQKDNMGDDTHPHGARELVADNLAANNQQRL